MRSPRLLNLRCGNHDAVEMSRELCVVADNRGFGDGDTKNAKNIQSFRKDCCEWMAVRWSGEAVERRKDCGWQRQRFSSAFAMPRIYVFIHFLYLRNEGHITIG